MLLSKFGFFRLNVGSMYAVAFPGLPASKLSLYTHTHTHTHTHTRTTPSDSRYVLLVNCSNILIADFTFDILPLPYTAARVISVSSDDDDVINGTASALFFDQRRASRFPTTVTVELEPNHPQFESRAAFSTYGIAEIMTAARG